jgi:hypothetical protein
MVSRLFIQRSQRGIAILETSAIMLTVIGILLSAWAAIDLFQRGIALNELLEATYYDGVVSGYQISADSRSVNVNRTNLSRFTEAKINDLAKQIELQGIPFSNYALQGALIEVVWKRDTPPIIEKTTLMQSRGGLNIPQSLKGSVDIEQLAQEYVSDLTRGGTLRESLLRPDIWQGTLDQASFLTDSFVLLGISAALEVDQGLAKFLLEGAGQETILVRSSFNSLRRDL